MKVGDMVTVAGCGGPVCEIIDVHEDRIHCKLTKRGVWYHVAELEPVSVMVTTYQNGIATTVPVVLRNRIDNNRKEIVK